ncbi:helix-turn-helix domain-containing protein [Hyphobacterium sp.]|uniref:helix-turn-helix domain-containing protein n=1 Tax=Hyphobacterium sp. TaxID=2004662 RepID=UPI003BAD172B
MSSSESEFWIVSADQLACLASRTRQALLDLVATFGPVSAADLARLSGLRRTTLYQHIDQLSAVGLVLARGHRGQGNRSEKMYSTPARRMRLARALADDRHNAAAGRIAAGLLRQTQRDISAGLNNPRKQALGPDTNLLFHRFVGAPPPENLTEINKKIEELKALMTGTDPASGPAVAVTVTMTPVDRI